MRILAAAVLLGVLVAGCQGRGQRELLAVGTCVVEDARGTTQVPCDAPHTHTVIAIAPNPEACPPRTVIWASPADPNDGTVTVCYATDP